MRRFVAVFKRDKTAPPPLVTDHALSSASSSSGSTSLQTPDDDHNPPPAVNRSSSRKSWRSWIKSNSKKPSHTPLPDYLPSQEPSLHEDTAADLIQAFTLIVTNSLDPLPPPPTPFSHRVDPPYIFPKSVNPASTLPKPQSLATVTFKKRILTRLKDQSNPFTKSELLSIASLTARQLTPLDSPNHAIHPFNESAPSKSTITSLSSSGLGNWILRPCFEDRYDLFIPEQDGPISRHPVQGSNLAVAALEFSETLEVMADADQLAPSLVLDIPPEIVSTPPPSSAHSRNSPYITVPSPLRNEHNLPPSPSATLTQPANPAVAPIMDQAPDTLVKRGVRFVEDDKDDVIPLGHVLRMKRKREEKAKFLKAEQERRLLEVERQRMEEERRKRDAERAEWEMERKAWEKEKRAMEEERRQRKYAEEVTAARLRRENQRAGGVPSLKSQEGSAFLVPSSGAGYFPASASSTTSERNKRPPSRTYSRPAHDDGGSPVYLPRREASDPNLPIRINTNPSPSGPTPSPHGSHNSQSPGSSRPPSVNRDTPPSAESSSPLPTRSPSVYSSHEVASSSEDVKAAIYAASSRAKRNSLASSRNGSNTSLGFGSDRAISYPVWTGSSHSLNNMVPPVPMIPTHAQMMPMPAYAMMDMPLLPPTPPFMMQQYPRQNSPSGSKSRQSGSQNSSRERLSLNSSKERVNVIGGTGSRSGSLERPGMSERTASEGRINSPRSSSFPRPEAPRHSPSSPAATSGSGSSRPHHVQHASLPGPSSRRASMPVAPGQFYNSQQQPPRQSKHDARPPPPVHAHSQPTIVPQSLSSQMLQPPSPWTGIPTQSGKLPNGNSNGGGHGSRGKAIPPRHMSYSGVGSEGTRQQNMRAEPPRHAKRQTVIS
ncbi:hypothetical protein H0H92_004072 [Tricholoma furcatifolium]|nr:hypothetical protein H0H92_004072 [Tricholoma furcatifolium]